MRAPWIVEFLKAQDYDIVVLQEVIDKRITELLKQGLKEQYPCQVSVDAKRGVAGCSGGILLVSRRPLKYVDHTVYQNITGVDALAEKGCVLVEAQHNGVRFQIAGTHLQAGDDKAREKEIPEIAELLGSHRAKGVPLLLFGDMNLSPNEAVFAKLVEATETIAFPLEDPDPTTTSPHNSWSKPNKQGRHIDHVLLSPRGTATTIQRQTVQRARRDTTAEGSTYPTTMESWPRFISKSDAHPVRPLYPISHERIRLARTAALATTSSTASSRASASPCRKAYSAVWRIVGCMAQIPNPLS